MWGSSMMIKTWPLPVVQAPMAGAQGHRLAAAVCGAGGLGSIPAGMLTLDGLTRELAAQATAAPGLPFNLNFFCHTPPVFDDAAESRWRTRLTPEAQAAGIDWAQVPAGATRHPLGVAMVEVLERLPTAQRPAVVSFHFGLPAPALLARVRALGCDIWSSATTVDEARWLVQHGADAVIAQGLEAGGHRGHFLTADPVRELGPQRPLAELLPAICAAVSVPVIAAGGIGSPQDVAAVLAAGAGAAQVGTAYLHCPEADTSPLHRAALQAAANAGPESEAAQTALTNVLSGRPARGLFNRLMREHGPMCADAPAFPLASAALVPLRTWAETQGRSDFSPLWAGSRCGALGPSLGRRAADLTRWLAGMG